MAGDDEMRAKRRKGGAQCNEMGYAIAVASVLAMFIFIMLSRSATEPQALSVRPHPISRTRSPTFARSHSGAATSDASTDTGVAVADILAEEQQGEPDPMLVEGPTATPPPAGEPDPMLVEGPTATPPPAGAPPPIGAPPAPPAAAGSVPWPRGIGNQPPTTNPYFPQLFPPSASPTYDRITAEKATFKASLPPKYGKFCAKGDTVLWDCLEKPINQVPSKTRLKPVIKRTPVCNITGPGFNHCWDNASNWDLARMAFCDKLNKDTQPSLPTPPAGMMQYIDLVALEAGKVALPGGTPRGELKFDPIAVREHFFKAQAALAVYYQGTYAFTYSTKLERTGDSHCVYPGPADEQYTAFIDALAKRFAAAFINSESLVFAGIGDSTMAGADNCYYDNWLSTLERQLKPLFAVGGVPMSIRNCAHNGGFATFNQMVCAEAMVGEDADFVLLSTPFVRPQDAGDEAVPDELFIRRALSAGILPQMTYIKNRLAQYAEYGVSFGPAGFFIPPILNGTGGRNEWWPALGKANWARVGDGMCHAEVTRSGSASVLYRNWHPGPIGHQIHADAFAFVYMTAAIQALTMLDADLKASNGKLGPLRAKYRGREAVKEAAKTWPKTPILCEPTAYCKTRGSNFNTKGFYDKPMLRSPGCDALCAGTGVDLRFPKCIQGYLPSFGRNASEWLQVEASAGAQIKVGGPMSKATTTGIFSQVPSFETFREPEQCEHKDFVGDILLGKGPAVFKIPKGTMTLGVISGKVFCGRNSQNCRGCHDPLGGHKPWEKEVEPVISVQIGATGKVTRQTLQYMDDRSSFELADASSWTLAGPKLPVNQDIYLHIDCSAVAPTLNAQQWALGISGVVPELVTQ